MKAKCNGQGHHPFIRPPFWGDRKKGGVIKVIRRIPPKAWQLAMMRMGLSMTKQQEPMYVEMGCGVSGAWYVDTDGYGMLQANDAEPPPKQGWLHKVLQYAAVFLFGMMLLNWTTSCKKPIPEPAPTPEPTPDTITSDTVTPVVPADTITPVNPGDTVTPIVPGDTITPVVPGDTLDPSTYDTIPGRKVDLWVGIWMPESGHEGIRYPTKDTIRFYANHPGCDTIFIKWYIPPNLTAGWTPDAFHSPRDTLKTRFAMSPKIYGGEKIYVNKNYGGASIPCADSMNISKLGMTECDSAIFAGWGYEPTRLHFGKTR